MNLKSDARKTETGRPERERFSSLPKALGIFAGFLLLLAILFPKQRLMDMIVSSKSDDAATVSYLESMLRVRPADSYLRLKYAGVLLRDGKPLNVLNALDGMPPDLSGEERRAVLELRRRALSKLVADSRVDDRDKKSYLKQLNAVNRQLGIPPLSVQPGITGGGDVYMNALSRGDYRGAAAASFEVMRRTADLERKRSLFFQGVSALQMGNLPVEAFAAGESNLGGLSNDRRTLEFLARAALSAGRPDRAQILMKRALGMKRIIQPTDVL